MIRGSRRARSAAVGAAVLFGVGSSAACATKKPVLYPNAHLQQVGADQSQRDIDECIELAKAADLESSKAAEAAKSGAIGAGVGGAAGAAGGAIAGSAARGAGAGAAVGAIVGVSRGLFRARDPDPLLVNYVDMCLGERGYRIVGWK